MYIGQYELSHTKGQGKQALSYIRVYLFGKKLAEIAISQWDALSYIREHPKSKYRTILTSQLRANKVPEGIIDAILERQL